MAEKNPTESKFFRSQPLETWEVNRIVSNTFGSVVVETTDGKVKTIPKTPENKQLLIGLGVWDS